jgi:hypothetical protein
MVPWWEKAPMTKQRRRLKLLGLIGIELVAGVLILRWVLGLDDPAHQAQPAEVDTPIAVLEPRSTEPQAAAPAPEAAPAGTATVTPIPTAPPPVGVWVEAGSLGPLLAAIQEWLASQPDQLTWADASTAELIIGWQKRAGAQPLTEIILVPVVPFYSLHGGIQADELRRIWLGRARSDDAPSQLLVTAETSAALDGLFGPRSAQAPLSIVSASDLAERLWNEPGTMAIVPFDQLEPRFRPLPVDGLSALDREFELPRYPLRTNVWISGPAAWQRNLVAAITERGLSTTLSA